MRRRRLGRALAALTAVGIGVLTLWPMPEEAARSALTPLWCLVCGDIGMQDVIQNVLMLLPLGLGLVMAGAHPRTAALAGLALSLLVEVLQYGVVPGRDASLSDVVTNGAGAALGAWLATRLDVLLHPTPAQAARLAWGTAGAWLALWTGAAWLLGLSPGPAPWRVDVQPDIIDAPAFEGEVRDAAVAGVALRHGLQDVPPVVRDRFAADSFDVVMSVVAGPRTTSRRGLLEVRDAEGRVNAVLAQLGVDGRIALRIRGSDVLLRPIRYRLPRAFDVEPGTPLTLAVRREGAWLVTQAAHPGAVAARTAIGPHWLAAIMLPVDAEPGRAWELFAYLWVAGLLALAGWWASRAPAPRVQLVAIAALVAVALAAVSPLFRLASPSLAGWLMALGGLALGAAARRPLDAAT